MNTELFIAHRITKQSKSRFSRPLINIATFAISISITVMILSVSIVTGFQKNISDKVIGFGSHIQITNFTYENSYESEKIRYSDSLKQALSIIPDISHIQAFATKAAVIKKDNEIYGVVLKGMSSNFDPLFFEENMVQGTVENYNDSVISNKILISHKIAKNLNIHINDKIIMYFIQNPPRSRVFYVSGIYETGLAELDELIVIGDIKHIQKLNDWRKNEVGGLEIQINDFNKLDEITNRIYENISFNLNTRNIKKIYPQIFDWLNLQDINVQVIIFLMIIVASINMMTALLILILERTHLIGLLKSIGANNWSIRKIFLYNSFYIIAKGMFYGNLIGITIAIIQLYFEPIKLNEATYYMSVVPINLNLLHLILLNTGSLIICWSILIIPSYLISKITPIKSIQFK